MPSSTESHYRVSPTLPNILNKLKDNIHQNYTEDGNNKGSFNLHL